MTMVVTTIDSLDMAPVGSVWRTDAGADWRVIQHIGGEYVKLERIERKCDFYTWHIKSLTQTTAMRVS
jgi:hypothetical protein